MSDPIPTPPRIRGNTTGPARAFAIAFADELNRVGSAGWVCEECSIPATHVWACGGVNRIYHFGLCTAHSDPGDPDAVSVRIQP